MCWTICRMPRQVQIELGSGQDLVNIVMELFSYFLPFLFLPVNSCLCQQFLLSDFLLQQFLFKFFSSGYVLHGTYQANGIAILILYQVCLIQYVSITSIGLLVPVFILPSCSGFFPQKTV